MKVTFKSHIHHVSVNSFYTGDRRFKSAAAVEWSRQTCHTLNTPEILAKLEKLRNHFDPTRHSYSIDLTFYYPEDRILTKSGVLSSRSIDISNSEKHLVDLLFLPKFFDKESPEGLRNLNIDDRYLTDMVSKKRVSKDGDYSIEVTISILNLKDIQP